MTERRLFFLGVALAAGLYFTTASGLVTWSHYGEDGPELEGAARTLGIAHPPGYPLYTLLARLVGLLLPVPWSAVNALTLLAALAAVGTTGVLTARVLRRAGIERPWLGAIAAMIFLAVSPSWWKQASIGEVYTLHMALIIAGFLLLVRGTARDVLLAAYVFGLGLAHHPLTLPALLVALVYVLARRLPLRAHHVALLLLPITLYGALFVRSHWAPVFDWGEPRSLDRLWWVMSGAPYHQNLFRDGWQAALSAWGYSLQHLPGSALGWGGVPWLVAGTWLFIRAARQELLLFTSLFLGSCFVATAYEIPDPAGYFLPAVLSIAVVAGAGVAWTWQWIGRCPQLRVRGALAAAMFGILGGALALQVRTGSELARAAREPSGYEYALAGTSVLEPNAVVLSRGDGRTFSLWYGSSVLTPRADVAVVYESLLDWTWYRAYLADRHPTLVIPPRAPEAVRRQLFLRGNLAHHPVYVTEIHPDVAARFDLAPAGPLVRLREPVTAEASSERTGKDPLPRPPS